MKAILAALGLVALTLVSASASASASANDADLDVIVDTFSSDPDHKYEALYAWAVTGKRSIRERRQDIAMPFTPDRDYLVKKIIVAAQHNTGTNAITVTLNADADGLPGAVLKKATLTDLPEVGTCCVTATMNAKGVAVSGGARYWVVLKTDKKSLDMDGGWNINSIGATGTFAYYTEEDGWALFDNALSAFSVLGK